MMVFAFATTAFAAGQFTDIADLSKESQDAISKLSALEIIGGYPDGTFKPGNTITRAEFAKMACVAGGMAESADILGGTTSQFSDVKANEWYTGYINLAVSQGYVKGYPDGTFKPNNTITNAEVITVIMRILGYNDNLPGPWPVDYVAKAGNLEITTNIVTATNANAVRGDVARMIDNALEENVVVWNNDIDDFDDKYQNRSTTLLAESFKGQTTEDRTVSEWSVDSFTKGNLRLTLESEKDAVNGFVVTDATVIGGGYTLYNINDMIVDVIYKYDKDLDKNVAKYVDVKSTKATATKASKEGDTKVKFGDKTYTAVKDLDMSAVTEGKNSLFTAYIDEDNIVYKIKNDRHPASESYVVDEYLASSQRIDTYAETITLKGDDVMIFDQDGKAIEPTDLKNKDIIKVYENKGDADKVIFVEGWTDGTINDDLVTNDDEDDTVEKKLNINGSDYVYTGATTFFDDDEDSNSFDKDYLGTKVQYALDAGNRVIGVIYTETALGNTIYGIVTNMAADTSASSANRDIMYYNTITLFNQDGKTVKYDAEELEIEYLANATDPVKDGNKADGTAAYLAIGDLVKVRLTKDGEIHRVYSVGTELGAHENAATKADVDTKNERITLGNTAYPVLAKIAAFDVTMENSNGGKTVKVDSVSLITKEEIVSGDVKGKAIFYIEDADGDLVAMKVEDFSSTGNSHFGFIDTVGSRTADIDYGIKFKDDAKVYEVTKTQHDALKAALADAKEDNNGLLFVRYELSGDKVTVVENAYEGAAIASKANANIAEVAQKANRSAVDTVKNGVYKLANGTEFTVEDNTDIFEITYKADGSVYSIKAVDSVGKSDVVSVQTRGKNIDGSTTEKTEAAPTGVIESGLDTFEKLQAEFVVIHNTSEYKVDKDDETQNTVQNDVFYVTTPHAAVTDAENGDAYTVSGDDAFVAEKTKVAIADAGWYKLTINDKVITAATPVTVTANATGVVKKVENNRLYVTAATAGDVDFPINSKVVIYNEKTGKMGTIDEVTEAFGADINWAVKSGEVTVIVINK